MLSAEQPELQNSWKTIASVDKNAEPAISSEAKLEKTDKFCHLGDMLNADWHISLNEAHPAHPHNHQSLRPPEFNIRRVAIQRHNTENPIYTGHERMFLRYRSSSHIHARAAAQIRLKNHNIKYVTEIFNGWQIWTKIHLTCVKDVFARIN